MIRLGIALLMWLFATAATAAVPKAQALWDNGAYRQAVAAAFEAANAGDPQAQFILGEAYRLGRSVDPDDFQARDWYLRAARQGDVASAAALGELLVHMRQSRDAVQWLTLAASHDHARATALLAAIYYTGDGAEPDLVLATSLMKKAAALGSPEAKARLAMMDDTAAPVDVSSPEPQSVEQASRGTSSDVRVASVSSDAPKPHFTLIVRTPITLRAPTRPLTHATVHIQVGAFKSAANAHRALQLVAAQTHELTAQFAIERRHGFYRLLLIADDRESASAARSRLVEIKWQHFVRGRHTVAA